MSRFSVCCLLLGVFVLPGAALGQVNTERMRALDVEETRLTFGGDVALQSGNVDLFEVGGTVRFDARRAPHYAFFVGELRYGTKSDVPFRDRAFGHLRYNYRLGPWLVGEAFSQLERNGFTQLQLRLLTGGGLRIRYLDTDPVKVFQGTTPMYEYENLDGSTVVVHPARTSTLRWSNYLNARIHLTDTTHLLATVYVQPRLSAFSDVRVLHQTTLALDVTDHVRFTTELNLSYDSRPPDNVEDLDLTVRNGLRVSF